MQAAELRILWVEIAPEALAEGALLGEMLQVATNAALEESQRVAAERLQALGPAIGLPGLGF